MENEELFKSILIEDEKVKVIYKPSKSRYIYLSLLGVIPVLVIILGIILLATFLATGVIPLVNAKTGEQDYSLAVILYIMASIPLIILIVVFIARFSSYKNAYYCITNKRAIIRTGFTAIHYRHLNLDTVSGVDLYIGALDKLAKPNTGILIFAHSSDSKRRHLRFDRNRHFAFVAMPNPEDVKEEIERLLPHYE